MKGEHQALESEVKAVLAWAFAHDDGTDLLACALLEIERYEKAMAAARITSSLAVRGWLANRDRIVLRVLREHPELAP